MSREIVAPSIETPSLWGGFYFGLAEKVSRGGRVWGVGCGVWGFTDFQGVNYLIFREKVPEFPPRSLLAKALFDFKKA
jgi:hypothetical protein